MPFYLMRFSYTPDAWARLIKKPEDRREIARAVVEKLVGSAMVSGMASVSTTDLC